MGRVGRRQFERGLEPFADGQNGRPFPVEHRLQEVVLGRRGHQLRVHPTDRLIEQGFEGIAKLGVQEQVFDLFGSGGVRGSHVVKEQQERIWEAGELDAISPRAAKHPPRPQPAGW